MYPIQSYPIQSKCLDYIATSHSRGMLLEQFTLFKNRHKNKKQMKHQVGEIKVWWEMSEQTKLF